MINKTTEHKCAHYWEFVRFKREKLRLTEEQLANLIDMSDREIRNIEYGISTPRFDTVLKLAGVLKIDMGEFNRYLIVRDMVYDE